MSSNDDSQTLGAQSRCYYLCNLIDHVMLKKKSKFIGQIPDTIIYLVFFEDIRGNR